MWKCMVDLIFFLFLWNLSTNELQAIGSCLKMWKRRISTRGKRCGGIVWTYKKFIFLETSWTQIELTEVGPRCPFLEWLEGWKTPTLWLSGIDGSKWRILFSFGILQNISKTVLNIVTSSTAHVPLTMFY